MKFIDRTGAVCLKLMILLIFTCNAWAEGEWATNGDDIYSTNNGNVGIGTTNPDNAQNWNKVLNLHGPSHAKLLVTESSGVKTGIFSHAGYNGKIGTESNHNLTLTAGYWNDVMTLTTAGNVGIGTATPSSRLAVNGTISAKEIKVTETGWSDFVFEDTYELPSLDSVESYIKKHKHLPDIPSAKEVKEQGLAVSDMLAKQMQKIEEMTLYLIELKAENNLLKTTIANQDKQLANLKELRGRIEALEQRN